MATRKLLLLPVVLVMSHRLGSLIFLPTLLALTRSGLCGKHGPGRNLGRGNTAGDILEGEDVRRDDQRDRGI